MTIDWIKLLPALLVLLVPIGLFHGKKTRCRPIERDWAEHWSKILGLGLHWIDLGRAIIGGWWLVEALELAPDAGSATRYLAVAIIGAVMIAATILQVTVCRDRGAVHAPFMFVSGLLLGAFPPAVAAFPIALAAALAMGMQAPTAYFPLLAVSLMGAGYFFEGRGELPRLVVAAGAVFTPWASSFLLRRTLVVSYRTRRAQTDASTATID